MVRSNSGKDKIMDAKAKQQEHFRDFPTTPEATQQYYDQHWGPGKLYDKDMADWQYSTPEEGAALLSEYVPDKSAPILDAGCGTGLVGTALKNLGYNNIVGADFSKSMLDGCPENTYKELKFCDLNKDLPFDPRSFSAVISIGTFTFGHLDLDTLDRFCSVAKQGAPVIGTCNVLQWKEIPIQKKLFELDSTGVWDLRKLQKSNYLPGIDLEAWMWAGLVK